MARVLTPAFRPGMIRLWRTVHRWSSLGCTLFLLLSCVTGLPMIFSDEIDALMAPAAFVRGPAVKVEPPSLDGMITVAAARYPQEKVRFVFFDKDERQVKVVLGPADMPDRRRDHPLIFDADSGMLLDEPLPVASRSLSVMGVLNRLHTDLFAGFAGEMLLGVAGVLLLVAIVSGVVLYAPYMKRLSFGTLRLRNPRIRWLDLHNLAGIAITAWLVVVGATGVLNEVSKPLAAIWRAGEAGRFGSGDHVPMARSDSASVDAVFTTVRDALPENNVTSIIFPSRTFNNPRHFLVWSNGNTPLTHRLFSAAFVDAASGRLTSVAQMPGYLRALQLSRPLHFGDFGGMPLKVLWAFLDVIAILVLVSGFLLYAKRKKEIGNTQA
jgi:uncharacterized iron-regulated membrane protein